MSKNYRLSQECCGNDCGTKTVNQKFENKTRMKGENLSAKGIHAHWIGLLALLLIGIVAPNFANAQSCGGGLDTYSYLTTDYGASNTHGPIPTNTYRSYRQYIFERGSMCKGYIKKIAFWYKDETKSMTHKNNVKIYMVETDRTSFSSTTDWIALSSFTLVYSGSLNCAAGSGWNYFTLSGDGFNFSGEHNLAVAILDNSNALEGNSGYTFEYVMGTSQVGLVYNSTSMSDLTPGTTTYTGNRTSYRPSTALCIECNNCTDRTGSITFTNTPLNLIINHSSSNNNIATNTVSPSGTIHFNSSNTSVATVDENTGIVTSVATGSAVITASIADDGTNCEYKNTYTVNVSCIEPIFQWSDASVTVNQSSCILPTLITNHPKHPGSTSYSSSSTAVASINSSGVVSINGTGTTTITATVPASGDTCSATAQYTLTVEGPCTPQFDDTRENYYIRNFTATGPAGSVGINNTTS